MYTRFDQLLCQHDECIMDSTYFYLQRVSEGFSESDSHSGSDSTLVLGSLDVLACVGLPDLGAI